MSRETKTIARKSLRFDAKRGVWRWCDAARRAAEALSDRKVARCRTQIVFIGSHIGIGQELLQRVCSEPARNRRRRANATLQQRSLVRRRPANSERKTRPVVSDALTRNRHGDRPTTGQHLPIVRDARRQQRKASAFQMLRTRPGKPGQSDGLRSRFWKTTFSVRRHLARGAPSKEEPNGHVV